MARKIAIGALGPQKYDEVTYYEKDPNDPNDATRVKFVQRAVLRKAQADRYVVLATDTVINQSGGNLAQLQEAEPGKIKVSKIGEGESAETLWSIFDAVIDAVAGEKDAAVTLDVTNGYRSLPMIMLAASTFLEQARGIPVERILYGMATPMPRPKTDAPRDPDARSVAETAPLVDMTPFLDLMEWTQAVVQLNRNGRGDLFAKQAAKHGAAFTRLAEEVKLLCQSLEMLRVSKICPCAWRVLDRLDDAETEAAQVTPASAPLRSLLADVRKTFECIAAEEPFSDEGMAAQVYVVDWYLSRNLYLQAAAVMREWLVTHHIFAASHITDLAERQGRATDRDNRKVAEVQLGSMPRRIGTLGKLFVEVADVRNDLLHCGFDTDARGAVAAGNRVRKIFKEQFLPFAAPQYPAFDFSDLPTRPDNYPVAG